MLTMKLKECCTVIAGQSPESKYYNTEGIGIPFFQGKADFGEVYPTIRVYCSQPTKIAEKDDILLSVRAPVGATNLSPGKVCIGRGLTAIRPSADLDLKYLLYFFRYYEVQLQEKGTGTTFKAITQDVVKNIEIPIPDIDEQKRIVSKVDELFSELDNGVETLKKTKQQLAVYRQAVLKEAFEGKFTAHIPCDVELSWASEEETKSLPAIPKEWQYIALSNLGDLGRGKSKHRPRNDPKLFEGGKYPFLQTGKVKAAKQYITEYSKMYGEFGLQQSKLWPKGTLCITIAANIAETAFLGIDACFPDSVVGFTPYEHIIPEYIKYFIESQKLRLWAFAPATAQKNINLDTLENLIVPYCSVEEQQLVIAKIEARMTICDSIEQTVDIALQQAEAMRQSILKKAFEESF
ncbi:MAG: restriction endonuclease subunit S [Oscillospiraceae bacterium]|nr:restriction endonuclease subunit S [Oscillospiraceae bacterium]